MDKNKILELQEKYFDKLRKQNFPNDWTLDWEGPIKKTLLEFIDSNKEYLVLTLDKNMEVCGTYLMSEPNEDTIELSYSKGDKKIAIFRRDFTKKINNNCILDQLTMLDCEDFTKLQQ